MTNHTTNMKKIILTLVAVIGFAAANAQSINVNINIGRQPVWGPVGYDYVDYYYLPDLDVYYYVPEQVYIYPSGNSWHRARVLPARYKNVDLYSVHKVVINGVSKPYLQNARYRQEYIGFKGKHDQVAIRDSREEKYFVNRQHPEHAKWAKDHPGNGNGNGNGRGNQKGKHGNKH